MDNQNLNTQENTSSVVQFKTIFYSCLSRWYWFVLSVVLVMLCAEYYLLKTTPVFTRNAKVLIKSDDKGRSAGDVSDFSDLGIFSNSVKINNELKTMSSIDVMTDVVKNLHLEMSYSQDGLFHPTVLYDKSLPAKVLLLDAPDNLAAAFDMKIDKGIVTLSDFEKSGSELKGKLTVKFNDTVKSPIGRLCVTKTDFYKNKKYDVIHVRRTPINSTARSYSGRLNVALADKNSDTL